MSIIAFPGFKLSAGACRPHQLAALAGLEFKVMNNCAKRNFTKSQTVSHFDIGAGA